MNELVENVKINGSIPEADKSEVEEKLNRLEGTLVIYNEAGNLVQQFGNQEQVEEQPLGMIEKDTSPDHFSEKQYTFFR